MIRQTSAVFSITALVALGGCASSPRRSLPQVQKEVADRAGLPVDWSRADESRQRTEAVTALLAQELTADTSATIALVNSRRLAATFAELGISEADLLAAGKLSNPTFAASIRWPDQSPRAPNVELGLSFELLNALLLPVRKNFAGEALAQAERRVAHEALGLVAGAKSTAYMVQARQQFRDRLAAILDVAEAAADLAQRQYDAGNINQLELLHQQAAAKEARLDLARADAEVRQDREKLNRVLGLWGAQTNWKMAPTLPPAPPAEPSFEQIEATAIAQRLDLAAAKSGVALRRAALDLKRKTRLLPASINVGGDTEREPGGTSSHTHVTGPTLELALPIFDQGQADVARLAAETQQAEASYEALAIEIRAEVRAGRDALLAARATAEYYDSTLLPLRQAILRETLLHYNAMQKSNYELLLARQQVLEAERARIDAWRDYWIARTDLERAMGGSLAGSAAVPKL